MSSPVPPGPGARILEKHASPLTVLAVVYPWQAATGRALYRVHNEHNGLDYALKAFDLSRPEHTSRHIQREMLSLNKRCLDPGLYPRCRNYFEQDGIGYLRLDWIPGKTLAALYTGHPEDIHDLRRRLAVFQGLLSTITALHRARCVHRDLKPENLLQRDTHRPDRGVALIDFGLVAAPRAPRDTAEGTAYYQAPEQTPELRERSITASTDVFALGQIGWFLFHGSPWSRFMNDVATDWDDSPPPSIEHCGPQVSAQLQKVLNMATAFQPGNRHADACQLLGDIRRLKVA